MLQRATGLFLLGILPFAFFPLRSSAASSPNIILITMESTRADRMGFLGARGKLTPHLDSLARECIVFERAYAQAPLTVVSHATILSGTYPQTHQASELGAPLSSDLPYLPSLLHTRGYRTAAFVGAAGLNPREGFAAGFDRGFDVYDAASHQRGTDQVAASATKWLGENSGKPFFLWVQFEDANASSGASYDRAVAGVDDAVGKIVTALRSLKLYDNSVLVVASDHGESLGSHGEDTHGIFLYDETIQVPLLVKLPQGQLGGKRVSGRVRLLDIAPTVLEAARVPVPSQMQGQSLLRIASTNPDVDQPVYARSDFSQQAFGWSPLESWRAGKYLYIRAPKPELYDLATDPGATRNLAQSSKATLETIAGQLEAFRSHFDKEHGKTAGGGLTSSEMQKLASLGYVGLQKPASDVGPAASGSDPKDGIATANQILNEMTRLAAGKADGAVPVLEQAIKAYPNAYLAHYELGIALVQQQRYPEAIEHLHRAIEIQPASVLAHYQMAEALVKTGDFKTAVVHLELVCDRLPKFRQAHLLLAESYDRLGQGKQAQAEREKAAR
jgi:choline-sulfatase